MSGLPNRLVTRLLAHAEQSPEKPAIYFDEEIISYRELAGRMLRSAEYLVAKGIKPGDRVALMLRNRPEYLILNYAIWAVGAVLVPINVTFAPAEVRRALDDSGATLLFVNGDLLGLAQSAGENLASLAGILSIEAEAFAGTRFTDYDGTNSRDFHPVAPRDDRLTIIAYTSGTTGTPKGAMLDDGHLADGIDQASRIFGLTANDNILHPFPVHSVNPCRAGAWLALSLGSAVALLRRFDAALVARSIERHRISLISTVPTMLLDLLGADLDPMPDLSSLKILQYGGAPTPASVRAEIEKRLDLRMVQSYGSTEAVRIALDPLSEPARAGATGRVLDWVEVSVRGADGSPLPPGEIGEFWIRGAARPDRWGFTFRPILGYWGDPEKTSDALRDGWYLTGDMGYVDADGWLFLVDRTKDMLIRGGNNIYPAELERALQEDDRVQAAYVVGENDERLGQIPYAYIVGTENVSPADIGDIIKLANAKLAKFKRIEGGEWILPDDLPRNAMHKVLKRELTDRANRQHMQRKAARA